MCKPMICYRHIRNASRPGPGVGISPRITDAEVITLALIQALLGFTSEARWLRHARKSLHTMFPYLPGQAGYNKRLRRRRRP
ncbi:hypothetical protein ACVWZ8_001613 [Arthrobacter sp. UYCu723]